MKSFAAGISQNFLKYATFEEATSMIANTINQLSGSQLDKANLLLKLNDLKNNIYLELERLGLENGHLLISEKYKYFFYIIN